MGTPNEELLATALWTFIERVREERDPLAAGLDGLTPTDAEALASLLQTAAELRLALETAHEPAPDGAAARVRGAIAHRREEQARAALTQGTSSPDAASRRFRWWTGLPWFGPARWWAAGTAVAALVVGVVLGAQLSAPDPLTHPPAAVRSLGHAETREQAPQLIAGRLSASEARAVLWHLAHCDRCFDEFAAMQTTRSIGGIDLARFAAAAPAPRRPFSPP